MQNIKFLQYFFYLASNWNVRIAWHIILREIKGEKKYNIQTTGADELAHLEEKGIDTSNSTVYMPASYELLEEIFIRLQPANCRHLVDIGCGKGRAMCVAAHYNIPAITGIDFSKEFCNAAIKNLEQTKETIHSFTYTVINNDAFYYEIPTDADCIFLFNPFNEIIMSSVVKNIQKSFLKNPRSIYIIYLNPMHKDLFLNQGYKEIFSTKKLRYLEACILQNKFGVHSS